MASVSELIELNRRADKRSGEMRMLLAIIHWLEEHPMDVSKEFLLFLKEQNNRVEHEMALDKERAGFS
jgi:hypothetical protein